MERQAAADLIARLLDAYPLARRDWTPGRQALWLEELCRLGDDAAAAEAVRQCIRSLTRVPTIADVLEEYERAKGHPPVQQWTPPTDEDRAEFAKYVEARKARRGRPV